MGLFDLFADRQATRSRHRRSLTIYNIFTHPDALKHDISFDLTVSLSQKWLQIPTTPKPPHLPRASNPVPLPPELLHWIIEAAYLDENLEVDVLLLKSCALVSKAWSTIAQRLLFAQVTLSTQRAFETFRNAVDRSTKHGRLLGDAVTRLRIVVDPNQPLGIQDHSFAVAVTLCPKLSELDISLYGSVMPGANIHVTPELSRPQIYTPSFTDDVILLLNTGPAINSLRFTNWSDNEEPLIQLLGVWPSLKSLSLSGISPHPPSPRWTPFSSPLVELQLNFQTFSSLEFISWLLSKSSDSLTTVKLDRQPPAHFLRYILDSHGSTLHSLFLPVACFWADDAMKLKSCTELREIVIEHCLNASDVCKNLPDTLEHVAIGVDMATGLQPFVDLVYSSDSLHTVTVHLWCHGQSHPLLSSLKIACACRGVDLRITTDIQLFRKLMKQGT